MGAAAVLLLGLSAQQALAVVHTEVGDAPSLAPGQTPGGTGALTSITGAVGGLGPNRPDTYRICVTGDGFSATTAGSAISDPQLFLFADNGSGAAVGKVANDDTVGSNLQSTLPVGGTPLTNGGTLSYPPGVYYLAITGNNQDPVDAGNRLIFPNTPFAGVLGPNPGVGALTGFTGGGNSIAGAYRITLTGASTFSSAPCGGQGAVCAGPPPAGAIVGSSLGDAISPAVNSTGGPKPTAGDDIIFGLAGGDFIDGGGGNDIICGGAGGDSIRGGDGNDFISGGDDGDALHGDAGNDVVNGDAGNDGVDGDSGLNSTSGNAGVDNCDNPNPPNVGDFGCEA